MFFQTSDDRLKQVERKVDEMEKQFNRTLTNINESLLTITDVIQKLEAENSKLKKERESIDKKRLEIEKGIKETGVKKDIKIKTQPVKNIISDNIQFIQEVVKDGRDSSMHDLYELVKKEPIEIRKAGEKLKVHKMQVDHWAKLLKSEKLLTVEDRRGKKILRVVR